MQSVHLGLPWIYLKITKKRVQIVNISRANSHVKISDIGVSQGSILGPLLFLIYITDLPKCLTSSTCILYADDTTIFTSNETLESLITYLITHLIDTKNWFHNNRFQNIPSKTNFEVFLFRQIPSSRTRCILGRITFILCWRSLHISMCWYISKPKILQSRLYDK